MPPVIQKSGVYAINYPQGRPYYFNGSMFFQADFPVFTASFDSGASTFLIPFPAFTSSFTAGFNSLQVSFPNFEAGFNALSGNLLALDVLFPNFDASFKGESISLDASVVGIRSDGFVYQVPTITVDTSVLEITADGSLTGTITIVSGDVETTSDNPDADAYTGDFYLVLNLKTKSHTTYRDGNNNAMAKTCEISFRGAELKNVSDAYLLARSDGTNELVVKSGENTERSYPINFESTLDAALRNKKVVLAKGLKSQNWQFTLATTDGTHLEVRSVDLRVTDLKRRVS